MHNFNTKYIIIMHNKFINFLSKKSGIELFYL